MKVKATVVGGVLAVGFGLVSAALAATAQVHYQDKPIGPQSLPGDALPPFGMLDAKGRLVPDPPKGAGFPILRFMPAPGSPTCQDLPGGRHRGGAGGGEGMPTARRLWRRDRGRCGGRRAGHALSRWRGRQPRLRGPAQGARRRGIRHARQTGQGLGGRRRSVDPQADPAEHVRSVRQLSDSTDLATKPHGKA